MDRDSETVERARRYPYRQPERSYIFTSVAPIEILSPSGPWDPRGVLETNLGTGVPADICEQTGLDRAVATAARTPVFGYGSNPAIETLRRKFSDRASTAIPVIAVDLNGFDAVYSSHIFGGFVPAALQSSPDTRLSGFYLYLTEDELAIMHETESLGENYVFARLHQVEAIFGDGSVEREVDTYLSAWGCLNVDGEVTALAGVKAAGRSFPQLEEIEVLELVHRALAPGLDFDQFVVEAATDAETALRYSEELSSRAIEFGGVEWTQISP